MPSRGSARLAALIPKTPEARARRARVFTAMDPNGNNVLSLAEVQKFMRECWPAYNTPRMLIRAFRAADTDGSELITRGEFRKFLKYVLFFDELHDKFEAIDANHDHRISEAEFVKGCSIIGAEKIVDPSAAFKAIDRNGGGFVLFDEFTVWVARKMCVEEDIDDEIYHDALRGAAAAMDAADGQKVRSGAWWKGRMKLLKMTKKGDPEAKKQRMKLFKRIDKDGSNEITKQEVFDAVQKMWPEFDSMEAVNAAFHAADRTGDGTIEKKEIRILLRYLVFYDDAWELFKQMDTNADGKLSLPEFKKGIHLLKLSKAVQNPELAYHALNTDGGEGVELDEFSAWLAEHTSAQADMVADLKHVRDDGDAAAAAGSS